MSFSKFLIIISTFLLFLNIVNAQSFEKNITLNFNFTLNETIFRYIEELDTAVLSVRSGNNYIIYTINNFSKNHSIGNIFNYTPVWALPTALNVFKENNIYYVVIYSARGDGVNISYYNFSSQITTYTTGTYGGGTTATSHAGFQLYNTINDIDGSFLPVLYNFSTDFTFRYWSYRGGNQISSKTYSVSTVFHIVYSSSPPSFITNATISLRNTELNISLPRNQTKAVFTKTIYGDYVLLLQADNNRTYVFFNTVQQYVLLNSTNRYVNFYQITPLGIVFSYQRIDGDFDAYVYCYINKDKKYYCDNVSGFFESYRLYTITSLENLNSIRQQYFQFNDYYIYTNSTILNSTAVNIYVKKTPYLIIRVFDERDRITELRQEEFYDFLGNSRGNIFQLYDLNKSSLFTKEGMGIYKSKGLLRELSVYTLPDNLKFYVNIKVEGINNNTKYFLRIERMYHDNFKFVRDVPIDFNFIAFTYLQYGSIYKIKVVDIDTEEVIYETGPFTASQSSYVIRISSQQNTQFKSYTNLFGEKLDYSCYLQNNKVICSFSNYNGKEINITFAVKKQLIFNDTYICDQKISAISGTFECELNNEDEVYVSLFWNDYNVLLFSDTLRKQKQVFQDKFSVFISLLIVLTLSFSAIFNPFVSIVLAIIGLIITTILGLIDLSISTLVGLIVVLLLIKIKEII